MTKQKKLLQIILQIRLHIKVHNGNGNFPDHENDTCKFMLYLFKFQNLKKLAIFKMDPFF